MYFLSHQWVNQWIKKILLYSDYVHSSWLRMSLIKKSILGSSAGAINLHENCRRRTDGCVDKLRRLEFPGIDFKWTVCLVSLTHLVFFWTEAIQNVAQARVKVFHKLVGWLRLKGGNKSNGFIYTLTYTLTCTRFAPHLYTSLWTVFVEEKSSSMYFSLDSSRHPERVV